MEYEYDQNSIQNVEKPLEEKIVEVKEKNQLTLDQFQSKINQSKFQKMEEEQEAQNQKKMEELKNQQIYEEDQSILEILFQQQKQGDKIFQEKFIYESEDRVKEEENKNKRELLLIPSYEKYFWSSLNDMIKLFCMEFEMLDNQFKERVNLFIHFYKQTLSIRFGIDYKKELDVLEEFLTETFNDKTFKEIILYLMKILLDTPNQFQVDQIKQINLHQIQNGIILTRIQTLNLVVLCFFGFMNENGNGIYNKFPQITFLEVFSSNPQFQKSKQKIILQLYFNYFKGNFYFKSSNTNNLGLESRKIKFFRKPFLQLNSSLAQFEKSIKNLKIYQKDIQFITENQPFYENVYKDKVLALHLNDNFLLQILTSNHLTQHIFEFMCPEINILRLLFHKRVFNEQYLVNELIPFSEINFQTGQVEEINIQKPINSTQFSRQPFSYVNFIVNYEYSEQVEKFFNTDKNLIIYHIIKYYALIKENKIANIIIDPQEQSTVQIKILYLILALIPQGMPGSVFFIKRSNSMGIQNFYNNLKKFNQTSLLQIAKDYNDKIQNYPKISLAMFFENFVQM